MSDTTSGIFHFFENLVTNFTWRRLFFIFTALFLFASGIILYESYTGHFRLDRMARSATLLDQLQKEHQSLVQNPNTTLTKIHEGIANELERYVGGDRMPFHMSPWALKAGSAMLPWVLVALILSLSSSGGLKKLLAGVMLVAVPLVTIGAFLPNFQYRWINYVAYPIGSCFVIMLAMWIIGRSSNS